MERPASKYDVLYKKYPFLSELPIFECGDGWFDLLNELCAKLDALKLGPRFKVGQVKEKFAALRFYVDDDSPGEIPAEKVNEVEKLISDAERKSAKTCECCGRPGKQVSLKRGCYIMTLCKSCEKKSNK